MNFIGGWRRASVVAWTGFCLMSILALELWIQVLSIINLHLEDIQAF